MVATLTSKDVISSNYKTISNKGDLAEAINLFTKDTDVLFVFQNSDYIGSLTEMAIVGSGLNRGKNKVEDLVVDAPGIHLDTLVTECSRLMIENDIMQLPVFQGQDLVGVVTAEAVLEAVGKKVFGERKASEFMSRDIVIGSPDDIISDMVRMFRLNQISRIPLVKDGLLEGIISMHDVVKKALQMDEHPDVISFMDRNKPLFHLRAESIMTPTVEKVRMDTPIRKVIDLMLHFEISAVVVIDEYLLPVGVITKRDILEQISNLREKSTPINVQISSKIKALDRKRLSEILDPFVEQNRERIGAGNLYVYFKRIGMNSDPQRMVQCRLHIQTDRMKTSLHSEGLDEIEAMDAALRRFDELLKSTEK